MEYFLRAIVQMGIFMICARAIIHFRPDGSYEKYMKMLVSAMVLVQVFLPFVSLFAGNGRESIEERVSWFEARMEESMEEARAAAGRTGELLDEMTLKKVRELLAEELQQTESEDSDKAKESSTGKERQPEKAEAQRELFGGIPEKSVPEEIIIEEIEVGKEQSGGGEEEGAGGMD